MGALVTGPLLVAAPIAILAGLVSFASPCVLPLVPGYLGYVAGVSASGTGSAQRAGNAQRAGSAQRAGGGVSPPGSSAQEKVALGSLGMSAPAERWRMVAGVLAFIAGFTVVFVTFGALAGTAGRALLAVQGPALRVLGVFIVLLGVVFLGGLPWLQRERRLHLRPGLTIAAAFPLGAAFGLGWTPCIGPTLAAVLAMSLDTASAARGALLSVLYCAGLGLPFLLIALAWQRGMRMLAVLRRHRRLIMQVGGGLLVAVGVAMILGWWGHLTVMLQGWLAGFETPL